MKIHPITYKIANTNDYSILKCLSGLKLGADRKQIADNEDINLSTVNVALMRLIDLNIIERFKKPSKPSSFHGRRQYIYRISDEYQENDKINEILEQIKYLLKQFS